MGGRELPDRREEGDDSEEEEIQVVIIELKLTFKVSRSAANGYFMNLFGR